MSIAIVSLMLGTLAQVLLLSASGGAATRPIEIVAGSVARQKRPVLPPGASIHVRIDPQARNLELEGSLAARIAETLREKGYKVAPASEAHYVLLFAYGTSPLLGLEQPGPGNPPLLFVHRVRALVFDPLLFPKSQQLYLSNKDEWLMSFGDDLVGWEKKCVFWKGYASIVNIAPNAGIEDEDQAQEALDALFGAAMKHFGETKERWTSVFPATSGRN